MFNMSIDTMEFILITYVLFVLFSFLFSIFFMLFGAKLYKKANKTVVEAIIPIYNLFVLVNIVGFPVFYFLLFLFPVINIILIISIEYKLCKLFGTSTKFFLGMLFLPFVFIPLLSFGKYKYKSKQTTAVEEEDNEGFIQSTPILMSQEELDKLNEEPVNVKEEDLDVDSIFKSDVTVKEDVEPYRAVKAEDDMYEDLHQKKDSEKLEVLDFEAVKTIDKIPNKEDTTQKDMIEIIDL